MTTTDDCTIDTAYTGGTCPDGWTVAEHCEHDPAAPFCAGPSLRECDDGTEVAEDQPCPTAAVVTPDCWGDDDGCVGPADEQTYSCEDDGTCDDSCSTPARGDCTAETGQPAPPPAELPATGTPADLALAAAMALAAGAAVLARTRRTR